MSAYGAISRPASSQQLETQLYEAGWDASLQVAVIHADGQSLSKRLVQYIHSVFNSVVTEGKTYPQEKELSLDEFKAYYLAGDIFLGVLCPKTTKDVSKAMLSEDQDWQSTICGMYYQISVFSGKSQTHLLIIDGSPGRSSHNCNAGFVVCPNFRGKKIGWHLAKSYLYFAPRLGYRASVFNLVYVNNLASVRLWDQLGFQRAGLIPEAGRLKTGSDGEEEYVDAIVYYKKFEAV